MHIQLLHTSASLTINENWDPDVRDDMEMMLNRLVPETIPFKHSCEGPDDMPAHAKACLLGSNLTLPICDGRVTLGTWQGVWLCEHRYQCRGEGGFIDLIWNYIFCLHLPSL